MSQTAYDLAQVQTRVDALHHEVRGSAVLPCHADPLAVGRSAADLARCYYRGEAAAGREPAGANIGLAQCVGCLIYGMELYGLDFLRVCELSNFRVACLLRDITPDIRMPQGPRQQNYRGQIGQAEPLAQVIKLAEIGTVCRQLIDTTSRAVLFAQHGLIKHWCDDHDEIVQALSHLRSRAVMHEPVRRAKESIVQVVRRIEEAKKQPPLPATPTCAYNPDDFLDLPDDDELDAAGVSAHECVAVAAVA